MLKSRVPGATEFNLISEFGRSLFTKYAFSISKVETVKDWGDRITALTHFGSNQARFQILFSDWSILNLVQSDWPIPLALI